MDGRPVKLDVYRTAIPMRKFEHAAASHSIAEAVVVRLQLADGRVGWGETLPRTYVTGETIDSVVGDLVETIWPALRDRQFNAEGFVGLMLQIGSQGRCINAACCAVDLAGFGCLLEDAAGIDPKLLPDLTGRARPRREIDARVSGVLGSADPGKTARQLRLMRWFGLRDFKLKLGLGREVDEANIRVVHRQLAKALPGGNCTLRVDVNGGWDVDSTPQRVEELAAYGVCVVEQPVFCPAEGLVELAGKCKLPLMADESLLTERDAKVLLAEPERLWWNIRLAKNGGLIRSLSLARLAGAGGVRFVSGCMVGESSILSAAQRRFLQLGVGPRFVEGNYGRLLLADDLTRRSLRFGYGGRMKILRGGGLGVAVDERKLRRLATPLVSLT